jgi:hypothetical protein
LIALWRSLPCVSDFGLAGSPTINTATASIGQKKPDGSLATEADRVIEEMMRSEFGLRSDAPPGNGSMVSTNAALQVHYWPRPRIFVGCDYGNGSRNGRREALTHRLRRRTAPCGGGSETDQSGC